MVLSVKVPFPEARKAKTRNIHIFSAFIHKIDGFPTEDCTDAVCLKPATLL